MEDRLEKFQKLIQSGIQSVASIDISHLVFSKDDWVWLFNESKKQAIAGIVWDGIVRQIEDGILPDDQFPPNELDLKWQETYGTIASANSQLTWVASLLTELTDGNGYKNAVLKGLSKGLLYDNPEARTPGDLDMWVENGKEYAYYLIDLFKLEGKFSYHHFHCIADLRTFKNVPLEIHFRPSSGSFNPLANRRIQAFLEAEIRDTRQIKTRYGYVNSPSPLFNMVSELVHIRRHFVGGGIGLRHMIDFYYIVKTCSPDANKELLQHLGLYRFWLAVAFVISYYLSPYPLPFAEKPDRRMGRKLLLDILEGGNFGWYAPRHQHNVFVRMLMREWRTIRLFRVCPSEFFWYELHFWWAVLKTIPERIKRRKLSLRDE